MANLRLINDLSEIPVGTECRIFGDWSDDRRLIELHEGDESCGEYCDGMQGNGIDIGIDDKTPGEWIVYKLEEVPLPDITATLAAMKILADRAPTELAQAMSLDEAVAVAIDSASAAAKDIKGGGIKIAPIDEPVEGLQP